MAAQLLPDTVNPANVYIKAFDYTNPQALYVIPLSTLSGNINAAALPTEDDTFTGATISGFNAGATIAQWEAVYLGSGATWLLADGNGSGTYPARGLATAAGTNGNPLTVVTKGIVRNDAWTWTPGGNIYLSNTPGGLSQTPSVVSGERVQMVGFALSADVASFDFTNVFSTNP